MIHWRSTLFTIGEYARGVPRLPQPLDGRWFRLACWRQALHRSRREGLPPFPLEMPLVPGRGSGLCKLYTMNYKRESSLSDSSDIIDSDDPMAIPSLSKHLKVNRPKDLLSRRTSVDLPKKPSTFGVVSSTSEEGDSTGRSRRSMPELPKSIEQIDEF